MTGKRLTKLCKTYGEYLCSYCIYKQPLGHCRYYKGGYTLKGDIANNRSIIQRIKDGLE